MNRRWAVIKRNCNFVGGFETASPLSIIQMAWTQVLLLARRWSRKKGLVSSVSCGTTLGLNLSFVETAIPIKTHPNHNTRMSGVWGPATESQNLENVLSLYCTPVTSGWEHCEDLKGIRSTIHSEFIRKMMTALKFRVFWTVSKWPSCD